MVDPHKEIKQEEHASPQQETSSKTFFIALGVFGLLLVTIFLIPQFFTDDGPKTLSELHQETLEENMNTETQYAYNGYSFVYYDGLWYTQIYNQVTGDLYDVPLHFGPKNVTDIVITGDMNDFFSSLGENNISNYTLQTYLTFNPNDPELGYVALATGELTQNLARTLGIAFIPACTEYGSGCDNIPIVSCENATAPVIYLTSGEPTLVYASGNCIMIQGQGFEIVRAVDRLLLKLYNIMI